ncbi:uncharacterized protein [Amphiura filiformis]|uniref:uncharacterized protein n=1 Tax=Amphiura filiformis TaxID=82378 RepID=UPI003B214089
MAGGVHQHEFEQIIINAVGQDSRCRYSRFQTKPEGKVSCLALGSDLIDDIREQVLDDDYLDKRAEITGIYFQKADTGRVKPILPNDVFSRVIWPNSPVNLRRPAVVREYIDLDDAALRVPAPVDAKWVDFANTMGQTRDALLTKMTPQNQNRPANLLKAFQGQDSDTTYPVMLETVIEHVVTNGHSWTANVAFHRWAQVLCKGCFGTPAHALINVLEELFPESCAIISGMEFHVPTADTSMNATIESGIPHCHYYGYVQEQVLDDSGAEVNPQDGSEARGGENGERGRGRLRQRVLIPKKLRKKARSRSRSPVRDDEEDPILTDHVLNIRPSAPQAANPNMIRLLNNPNDYLLGPQSYHSYFEPHKPDVVLLWRKKLSPPLQERTKSQPTSLHTESQPTSLRTESQPTSLQESQNFESTSSRTPEKPYYYYLKIVCETTSWDTSSRTSGTLQTHVDNATERCVQSCFSALAHDQESILGVVVVADGMKLVKIERSQDGNGFIYNVRETRLVTWEDSQHLYILLQIMKNAIN